MPPADKTDPPLTPRKGTTAWFESGAEVISADPEMAALMVRIGMVVNALTVHLQLGYAASQRIADVVRERDNLVSLVMSAALAFEAVQFAHKYQPRLRPLLQTVPASDALVSQMGRLLGGTHPASAFLERARNSLGFHWDYDNEFIGPIVNDFARKEKIVWVEEVAVPEGAEVPSLQIPSVGDDTVHRLASEVLAHALLPEVGAHSDPSNQRQAADAVLGDVVDAIHLLSRYFTTAAVAYLGTRGTPQRLSSKVD